MVVGALWSMEKRRASSNHLCFFLFFRGFPRGGHRIGDEFGFVKFKATRMVTAVDFTFAVFIDDGDVFSSDDTGWQSKNDDTN